MTVNCTDGAILLQYVILYACYLATLYRFYSLHFIEVINISSGDEDEVNENDNPQLSWKKTYRASPKRKEVFKQLFSEYKYTCTQRILMTFLLTVALMN